MGVQGEYVDEEAIEKLDIEGNLGDLDIDGRIV
jgi:hypothetical protein